jgi:hypothetical protein
MEYHAAVSESFVDVTYRGLSLGRRVKLAQVRPSTGYLEVPQPMPVGTSIGIITDDTVALDATVVAIHEQVAGSETPPGMVVRPKLEGDVARSWWTTRVTLPELEPDRPRAGGMISNVPVVVVQKRMTNPGIGVPEVLDDGHDTGVMDAIDPAVLDAAGTTSRDLPKIVDDGKKTTAMDAVDLAALGLQDNSAPPFGGAARSGEAGPFEGTEKADDGDDNAKPDGKPGPSKRRKRR